MNIFESLKKPFLKKQSNLSQELEKNSSTPSPDNTDIKLNQDGEVPLGFFDGNDTAINLKWGTEKERLNRDLKLQKDWIETYRKIASMPEVAQAISEIVDEATFAEGKEDELFLEFDADVSENIKNKFNEEFTNILNKINIKKNLYTLFNKFYIDGQLNVHCSYLKKGMQKHGIEKIKILNPIYLYFDFTEKKWKYLPDENNSSIEITDMRIYDERIFDTEFDHEEIVHIDSGIYDKKIILSDLHPAVKTANMLQTLEEMLIPMRFSRSVSRRVFNVDVANMNAKKAEEIVKELKDRFKYKKFYDVKSGTISNQQHIASLTEDYWFANRNGGKGTTVDTIDETGNLGETGDLDYFRKKLYTALKVPTNRLIGADERAEFDFTSTTITREELKFFNFITRKRNQFSELFIGLLKRQLVSTKVVTESEFNDISQNMKIVWNSSNKFFERMQDEIANSAISMFQSFEELANKGWVSKEFLYKKVLKFSEEEIKEIQKQIKNEKTNTLYKDIKLGDGGFDDMSGNNDSPFNTNDDQNNYSQEEKDDKEEKDDQEDDTNTKEE